MIKDKYFSNPAALLFITLFGLTACSSDITLRSRSYAYTDVNIPMTQTVNEKTASGGVLQLASANPVSTINVVTDKNSYGNMRRAITHGEQPSTVRLAEWLNYFSYDYPKPQGNTPLNAVIEIAPTPWNPSSKLMLVGVNASSHTSTESPANNIVVLVDISDGMDSSAVVSLVKNTLKELKDKLRPQDKIAFVTFSSTPTIALESTSGDEKSDIKSGIGHIDFGQTPTQSSAIGSFNLAYTVLENNMIKNGNNFILFITDGDLGTNENGIKSVEKTIARKNASGITLSTLVFNTGKYNYQAMQKLADTGGGIHAYIDTQNEANRVIEQQLAHGNKIVAQPVELQVTFNPDYIRSYRLLGYEKNNTKTMAQDKSFANALREGQTFTALYEIQTANNIPPELPHKYYDIGRVSVKYKLPYQAFNRTLDLSIVPSQIKTDSGKASKDFSFAAAVAAFALQLKKDSGVNNYSIDNIIELANDGIGKDETGLRTEFVWLLENTKHVE